jgi:ParB/RepB/Spo0J family partition protein
MTPHPVADLFPMMAADELADLAADIGERGLLHPVVLDADGLVLDGRNRLAACKLAGIDPEFVTYEGDDPAGYALASNIQRRNLTKSQTAMIAAKAWSVSDQTKRSISDQTGVSATRLANAKIVLDFASDLVDAVIAGAMVLDEAYKKARANKTAADSEVAQLERLRAENPDLADKVIQGELTLPGAWAELAARREADRKSAVAYVTAIYRPALLLAQLFRGDYPESIADHMNTYLDLLGEVRPDDLDTAAYGLAEIARIWRKHEEETG